MWKALILAAGAAGLAACATVPAPLQGQYSSTSPGDAQHAPSQARVRWGGEIVDTQPEASQTCFYVLSKPLDGIARPRGEADSSGRFVACHEGFYDPEVFAKGREITVTGVLHGTVVRKVGQYDYPYPRVEADNIYLWPRQPRYRRVRDPFYDPFYSPFYGPWGFGYGYDPFWYAPPPVIVVPTRHHHHHGHHDGR